MYYKISKDKIIKHVRTYINYINYISYIDIRFNYIFKFIFIGLLFLSIKTIDIYALDFEQSNLSQNGTNISIFVSIDPNNPNSSTINLYHDVITNIRQFYSNRWSIVKTSDITQYIDTYRNEYSTILRSVLYIDRKDFLASKERKEPIKLLQYILETFAIEDAIVVDCKTNKEALVESCGLYVYNRVKKKFTIAVEKIFTSPISDISSWGKILVDRLVYNIRNMEEESTQVKLNKLLEEKNENESDWNTRVELGFKISNVKSYVKNIYGLSFGVIFHDRKENINDDDERNQNKDRNQNIDNENIEKDNSNLNLYYGLRLGYDLGKKEAELKDAFLSVKYATIPIGIKYVYKSSYIFSSEINLGYSEMVSWNIYHKYESNDPNTNLGVVTTSLNLFKLVNEKLRYKKRSVLVIPRFELGYSWESFRLNGFIEYGKFFHITKDIRKKSRNIDHYIGGGITGSWYL